MKLYEFNQAGYATLPALTKEELYKSQLELINYIGEQKGTYYMLLNHDNRYYTLFDCSHDEHSDTALAAELIDLAQELGEIKSIEFNDNGAVEFWIVDSTKQCNLYLFFNYTAGVIRA